jgi:hypothetical protein
MTFERLYAFKLGFAQHLVRTRGNSEDYDRLSSVRKEILESDCDIDAGLRRALEQDDVALPASLSSTSLAEFPLETASR